MEPRPDFVTKYGIFIARALLVDPLFSSIPLRVMNPSDEYLTLHTDSLVANLEMVEIPTKSEHNTQHVSSNEIIRPSVNTSKSFGKSLTNSK